MGHLKAGAQMYTLRDHCKTASDTAATLKRIKAMGYRYVQVSCVAEPADTRELRHMLDDNGLKACSTHTSYYRITGETDRLIEEHEILGCEAIICAGLPPEMHNRDGYLKAAESFSRVMDRVMDKGFVMAYHNHGIELQRYDEGKTGLEMLIDNCTHLQAEIDTYWIQFGGGDPAAWIERFAGRCSQLHYKDMGIVANKHVMPPIGEGNLNWQRIIKASIDAGASYCLVEMDTPLVDAFKSLEISLKNMRSWGIIDE